MPWHINVSAFSSPPACCRLALSFLNEDLLMQLDDKHLQQAQAVRRPTLLNIAAAQLRKVGMPL